MVIKLPGLQIVMASSPNRAPLLREFSFPGPLFSIHTWKLGRLVPLNELYYPKGTMMSPSQILICVLILQLCLKWKECIFELRKIKKIENKLWSTLETYLKMLKIASYERKTLPEVEPLTFQKPFSQWLNTFTKITENGITAIVLEFTFKFHFLAITKNR